MDENNTQQGGFPDPSGNVNPQQPDTTGYTNPPQSDMTGYANPQQPDMTGYYGQQPGQPDMTGYYGQQPGQPDMTGYYGQQPGQPDMTGYYGQQPGQPDMTGYYGQQPGQPDMTGYYGQQPVQPGATGYYGQQPGTTGYYGQQPQAGGKPPKVKKPKKPMTKGKLGALIGAGVAIVALVVCGVIFLPKLFKSDKEVVLDALAETYASYTKEEALNDLIGYDDILNAYNEKGGTSSGSFSVAVGEGSDTCNVGVSVDSEMDQKNQELSGTMAISIGDSELLSGNVYADSEKMYVAFPEAFDGYLSYPTDDPFGAIVNSPIGDSLGLDAGSLPHINMNVFAQSADSTGVQSEYVDALETVWDAAQFEKQGKAKITVNGQNVTAKEYYVTWTKEDLQKACTTALDGLTEAVTESESALQNSGMSAEEYKSSMEQVKAMIPSIITSDLQVKVYVKDKKAVKITCKDSVSIMGMVKIDYDFWSDYGDNDVSGNISFDVSGTKAGIKYEAHDIKGNTNGTVTVFYGDKEFDVDINKEITEAGDTTTSKTTISATDYFTIELTKNFNKQDNSVSGTASADIVGADVYEISYTGGWKDIKKGVAYTLALDSFEVKAAGKTICTGAFSQTLDTSKIQVTPKDDSADVLDIETMTEDDLNTFTDKNDAKMQAWKERLENDASLNKFFNILEGLFSAEPIVEDTEEEYPEDEIATDDAQEKTLDDAVVSTYDDSVKYKVNGTIDGFEFNYASDYTVSFSTDEYSTIDYALDQNDDLQSALDDSFYSVSNIDSYDVQESNLNQTATVDGREVLYSVEKYVAFEMNCMDMTAVVEIEPGVYLVETVSLYLDDDSFSEEQLLEGLSTKYFTKQ